MSTGNGWWRELRRTASWHRRLLATGLAAAAAAAAIHAVEPTVPATTTTLSAARDLAAGVRLTAADLAPLDVPPDVAPAGGVVSAADVIGRIVAGPVRAGEILTDVRLLSPALVDGLADGLVATPVRVADAGLAALLRPGDRVDVLAAPATGEWTGDGATSRAALVAGSNLTVVAIPAEPGSSGYDGALLVLATTSATAQTLAAAAVTSRLSITVRGSS